jgi:hypothetical protein
MNGYVPHRGYRLPTPQYPAPYPRLATGGVPYAGVAAIVVLTMTSANLALDPVDNTPIEIDNLPAFSGPGGTFTGIQLIADRNAATPAAPAGFLQIVVTVDGAITTNALLAQAVVDAITAIKAAFYPNIPFHATRSGDAVLLTWDYAAAFPNQVQVITDTDWSTNEENPFFSGGFDAQPLLPARRGPPYAWLPALLAPVDVIEEG